MGNNDIFTLKLISFGKKYGFPDEDLDTCYDASYLHPETIKSKNMIGLHKRFRREMMKDESVKNAFEKAKQEILEKKKELMDDGKTDMIASIFCSFGQHRSVTLIEEIAHEFKKDKSMQIIVEHKHAEQVGQHKK